MRGGGEIKKLTREETKLGPGDLVVGAGDRCGGGRVFCDENAATRPAMLLVASESEDCTYGRDSQPTGYM